MKGKRGKGILLLLLLINLTACQTWQSVSLSALSPAAVESQSATGIRILVPGQPLLEVAYPMIEGDQLVGFVEEQRFSTPLSDIAMLEIRRLSVLRSLGLGYLVLAIGTVVVCLLEGGDCDLIGIE